MPRAKRIQCRRTPKEYESDSWVYPLRNAIVEQAVKEWRCECRKLRRGMHYDFSELTRFFKGEYIELLVGTKAARFIREQMFKEREQAEKVGQPMFHGLLLYLHHPGDKKTLCVKISDKKSPADRSFIINFYKESCGYIIDRMEEV